MLSAEEFFLFFFTEVAALLPLKRNGGGFHTGENPKPPSVAY
jgi:hypothetical protein